MASNILITIATELFLEKENSIFHLILSHNLISKFLKLIIKIPNKREL